jgi:hypothetical protein
MMREWPSLNRSRDERSRKYLRQKHTHAVVQILDDAFDQIFPTSQLIQVIESRKNFKLLQQPNSKQALN